MESYWKSVQHFLLRRLKSFLSSISGTIGNAIALNDSKNNSSNYINNNENNLLNLNEMSFLNINYKKTHNNRNNFKSNYDIR